MSDKFLEALKANDLQAVESLVRLGEDVNRRGIDGRTLLQTAVTEKVSVDILRFLLDKVDLTVRDSKGQSVVDLIFSGDFSGEFEEAFVNFVKGEILNGQPERLERMLLSGWGFWPVTLEQAKNVSEELADFISKLPELQVYVFVFVCGGRGGEGGKVVLSGWGFWPVTLEQAKNVSEELADFISKSPELQVCHTGSGEGGGCY